MTMLMLTACGSSNSRDYLGSYDYASPEMAAGDYGWDSDVFWDTEVDVPMESSDITSDAVEDVRKIIKNGSLSIETLDFDRFISELEASVSANRGYIESSSQNGNSYGVTSNRHANYTVRVPSEKYEIFISQVGELGTVTRSDTSTDDVTLQYVDIEARLSALEAERDSFMALMDRADTIDEILQIQKYLTDVNYQIESYTSQLNTLKSLVSYSTVNITVWEVERVTAPEPKTVWERISTNLDNNLYNIGEGFKDVFVAIVSSTPYLAILLVAGAIVLLIVFAAIKSANKKQKKYAEEYNKAFGFQNPRQNIPNSSPKPNDEQKR